MKARQVGRVTPCAPSVDVQAAARRGLTHPTKTRFARPQRRRRDIFVEPNAQFSTSPVGAAYSPPGFQPRTTRTTRTGKTGSRILCISRLSRPVPRPPMPLLRSRNYFCTAFYKYAAPTVLPNLRTATLAAEKAVLQNAVTATDRQIDALVYELYGLTEKEIKLVEGGQ